MVLETKYRACKIVLALEPVSLSIGRGVGEVGIAVVWAC